MFWALNFGGSTDQKSSSKMMSTSHVVSHPRIYEGTRGQIQVRMFYKHVWENVNAKIFCSLVLCRLSDGWLEGLVSLCLKTYVTHFHNVCFPLILQIRNIQNLLDINLTSRSRDYWTPPPPKNVKKNNKFEYCTCCISYIFKYILKSVNC